MATIFRKEDAMTANMEFGPKLVNDTIVALRPVLSNVRSDDALSP